MAVCMMVSCGSKDNSKAKEENATEQAENAIEAEAADDEDAAPKTKEGVIAMLREAYDDVNIILAPPEDDCEPNIDLVACYCSRAFNDLVGKVREVDAAKDFEDPFFEDWSRMWNFWDKGPVTPKDFDVDIDGDTAEATFELAYGKESATQVVALVYEDGQWRVNDWEQRGMDAVSMVEKMKEYIEP